MLANLFHHCLGQMLKPLQSLIKTGPIEMTSGDGIVHQAFPIFACFVGDYPEQVLVSGCKTGDCPRCPARFKELGELKEDYKYRDLTKILEALAVGTVGPYYQLGYRYKPVPECTRHVCISGPVRHTG